MAKKPCNFPTSKDDFTVDRQSGDIITSDSYDVIESTLKALEDKVGIDNSTDTTSLDYKITTKANKVSSPTAGNFASLKSDGDIQDSSKKASDFATASHQHGGGDITSAVANATEADKVDGKHASDFGQLGVSNTWTKNQGVTPVELTDGSTINTDASTSNSFYVTLGGNRTLANPSNLKSGATYIWRIKQDGTGSRTLSYGNKFAWSGKTAPTLTTAANAVDIITGYYDGNLDLLICTVLNNIGVPS